MPTALRPGPACACAAREPSVSASATDAPPCSSPAGWVLPATGIRPTARSGASSSSSIPIRSNRVPAVSADSYRARQSRGVAVSAGESVRAAPGADGVAEALVSVMRAMLSGVTSTAPSHLPASPATGRPRLLLIDGHSMAYRAFYALPDTLATSSGQITNAVYGFTLMLTRLLRDEQATQLGVAHDAGRVTFRTERYPEYKATRDATPGAFRGQVPLIMEVLDALRIPFVELEGIEADDILATLATQARAADMDVLICSGDRDALQLVNGNVTVLYPRKGVSELSRMDPEAVAAKYGVPPERYPDLAALVGETSDNLPGVPGVGPKTAAKWITAHGSLAALLDAADQVKGKAG